MQRLAGVDVGGTKMLGVVVDSARPSEVLAEQRVETPHGADAIVDGLIDLVSTLRSDAGPLDAAGLGVPGLVDRGGVLRVGPNLPGVVDADIRGRVEAGVGIGITVDNDATAAAYAEAHIGAGAGADDVVMVTLGTGIGGGIVMGGEIQRGANGFSGEFGHQVVDPAGPRCPCGRRGCWERFASGSGLGRLAREAAHAGRLAAVVDLAGGDPEDVRGEHVTAAASAGDAGASAVLDEFAWWVGLGLANIVTGLDPEVVILGGGVAEAAEHLLDRVRDAVAGLVLAGDHRPPVDIRMAALGERAGAIGAALLAQPG